MKRVIRLTSTSLFIFIALIFFYSCDLLDPKNPKDDNKTLVDTLINTSQSDVVIDITNKIKVEIPKGSVADGSRLTIVEESPSNYPNDEIYKIHFVYNVKIAGQTTFNKPIKITFNYNPAVLESGYTIDRLGTAYYNDSVKTWMSYPDAKVDSLLNTITFITNHLTPLSLTEFLSTGGYQHKFESSHFIIYYTYSGTDKVCDNTTYNDNQSQPWHITTGPEKNTPFYIQDLAHWLDESWVAYKGMGLDVIEWKMKVYVKNIGGAYGTTGGWFYGHLVITNDVGIDQENADFTRSNLLQGTAAHEMLHVVQDEYNKMTYAAITYRWWLEALATQADRMVWGNALQHYETEFYCKKITQALGNVLCHSLAFSWDKAIDWDWYAAGGFLSYLANYRTGAKLDLVKLVKAGSSANDKNYLDAEIKNSMGGTSIGSEYLCYVQWLYEKRHIRQQLPTVGYSPDNPMTMDGKLSVSNPSRKCSESSMPYLSTRLIAIKNWDITTKTEFEVTVSKPDPAIRIFLCEYKDKKMQILAELNDKEKRSLTIPVKNIYDILIVNTSKDNSLPFDITIAQKDDPLPSGTASLGSPRFVPDTINIVGQYKTYTIKSTCSDGTLNLQQKGYDDNADWRLLKITWNKPPSGSYQVVDNGLFWKLDLNFEFETIKKGLYVYTPNINIMGLSGSNMGSSGGYDCWRPSLMEPNFCLKLAPDNFTVSAGKVLKYSIKKNYDINVKLDCGSNGGKDSDGYITFSMKINNYFDEDITVVLKYFYPRD